MQKTNRLPVLWMIIAIVAAPSIFASDASKDYEKSLAKGQDALRNGKLSRAVKALQEADRLAGGTAEEPLVALAEAYYRSEDFEAAVETAERILSFVEDRGTLAIVNNFIGLSLVAQENLDTEGMAAAEEAFLKAIELSQDSAGASPLHVGETRFHLGLIFRATDRGQEAIEIFRDLLADEAPGTPLSGKARAVLCDLRSAADDKLPRQNPPVHVEGDIEAPVKIVAPQPRYNTEARKAGIQGVVITQVIIDREGCVENIKVLKGLPYGLEEAAVAAIKTWVFEPARLQGNAVDVYYNLTTNFRLGQKTP